MNAVLTIQVNDLVAYDVKDSSGLANKTGKLHKSGPLELITKNNNNILLFPIETISASGRVSKA